MSFIQFYGRALRYAYKYTAHRSYKCLRGRDLGKLPKDHSALGGFASCTLLNNISILSAYHVSFWAGCFATVLSHAVDSSCLTS